MGHKNSKESTILAAWKAALSATDADTSDDALCNVLRWAAEHGFSAEPDTAFCLDTWRQLGDRLLHEFTYGDIDVRDLLRAWGFLFDVLKEFCAK